MSQLTEKICFQLRSDDKLAACVAVKIRYPDFQTVSKQASFSPTSADDEIIPLVKTLFLQLYKRGEPVRLLGVRLSEFKDFTTQGNLFVDAEKKSHLYKAIDAMKSKFGKTSVRRASSSSSPSCRSSCVPAPMSRRNCGCLRSRSSFLRPSMRRCTRRSLRARGVSSPSPGRFAPSMWQAGRSSRWPASGRSSRGAPAHSRGDRAVRPNGHSVRSSP